METLRSFEWSFRNDHADWFRDKASRRLSRRLEHDLEVYFDDVENHHGSNPAVVGRAKVAALLSVLHGATVDLLRGEGRIR